MNTPHSQTYARVRGHLILRRGGAQLSESLWYFVQKKRNAYLYPRSLGHLCVCVFIWREAGPTITFLGGGEGRLWMAPNSFLYFK